MWPRGRARGPFRRARRGGVRPRLRAAGVPPAGRPRAAGRSVPPAFVETANTDFRRPAGPVYPVKKNYSRDK